MDEDVWPEVRAGDVMQAPCRVLCLRHLRITGGIRSIRRMSGLSGELPLVFAPPSPSGLNGQLSRLSIY